MRISDLNHKIADLWRKHFNNDDQVYAPHFYSDFQRGGTVFVGCNPSFSVNGFPGIVRDTRHEGISPAFLLWKNVSSDPAHIQTCADIDRIGQQQYNRYFKPLRDIAKEVDLPWEHLDLFLYRQTSQKEFTQRVTPNGKLNEFGFEQISIFKEALVDIQPRIIVVINALASKIILEQFENDLTTFDEQDGYHRLLLSNRKIPIFFSSMLTGGRLDRGSRVRLIWHIKQAKNKG